jgi:hypothetical protein
MKKGFALQYPRCHFNVAFSGSAVLKVECCKPAGDADGRLVGAAGVIGGGGKKRAAEQQN